MPRLAFLQKLLTISVMLTFCSEVAHAQLDQLALRVPDSSNALVVVNVQAAYASPFAKSQNWSRPGPEAHRSGMIALPTTAEVFLMAAEMDFEFMQPLWEVAVAHVQQMPTMQEIATRSGGRLDRLAGSQAVERPNDSFVVSLGPKIIGAMSPANRQQVTRWVRLSQRRKSPETSPYLAEALDAAGERTNHIVMAFDLQGILAPEEVASELAQKKDLLDEADDIKALSEVIASIRGIRLEVELQNPPQGRLLLDTGKDATILGSLAKPLLLAVLADHGAGMDDIQNWQARSRGKSITLEGELSQSGLRRVLSVLSGPVGPMAAPTETSSSADDMVAEVSQWYFQSITNYLNDLFFSDRQPQSMHQIRTWVQRYARKIEDLDAHQVDKEVVAFGRDAVDSLHEIVSVLDRAERRSDLRESTLDNFGRRRYGRYGAYGYFEKGYVTRDRELVQADEANRGLEDAQVIVDELRGLSAQTREVMTKRYDRQF